MVDQVRAPKSRVRVPRHSHALLEDLPGHLGPSLGLIEDDPDFVGGVVPLARPLEEELVAHHPVVEPDVGASVSRLKGRVDGESGPCRARAGSPSVVERGRARIGVLGRGGRHGRGQPGGQDHGEGAWEASDREGHEAITGGGRPTAHRRAPPPLHIDSRHRSPPGDRRPACRPSGSRRIRRSPAA